MTTIPDDIRTKAEAIGNRLFRLGEFRNSNVRLIGETALEKARRKQQYYTEGLDPSIASLRSVSLVNRIRISRDQQFDRSEQRERSYLEGVIAGLFK